MGVAQRLPEAVNAHDLTCWLNLWRSDRDIDQLVTPGDAGGFVVHGGHRSNRAVGQKL